MSARGVEGARRAAIAAIALLGWLLPAVSAGTTFRVDDDAPADPGPGDPLVSDPLEDGSAAHPFDAIQEAIDVAQDEDTVLVLDGLYAGTGNRDLYFEGRSITVASLHGPESTVIDCGASGAAFTLWEGDDGVLIDGFTLQNVHTGIECARCGVTVANCVLTATTSTGMRCWQATPLIVGCTFRDSTVPTDTRVSPLYCHESNVTVVDCVFVDNETHGPGGAITCAEYSTLTLRNCEIARNVSWADGGGVLALCSRLRLERCTIESNVGMHYGGGVCIDGLSEAYIVRSSICGNTAYSGGGGLFCRDSRLTLASSLVAGNRMCDACAYGAGGGIVCDDLLDGSRVAGCTIAHNSAVDAGGGVFCSGGRLALAGSVIYGNVCTVGPQLAVSGADAAVSVEYCNVAGGETEVAVDDGAWLAWGPGNIDADPMFVAAGFWDDGGTPEDPLDDVWVAGDYRLLAGSPCVDAGDNRLPARDLFDLDEDGCLTDPLPVDANGRARYVDDPATEDSGRGVAPIADMGACEFASTTVLPGGPCAGDLNCDGAVDFDDIDPFVLALVSAAVYEGQYPECDWLGADCDNDGDVDFDDIDVFVTLVAQ